MRWFGMSTSRILRILESTIKTPDSTGNAPPESPVPDPLHERDPLFVAGPHDPLYLLGGLRQDDEVRDDPVVHQAVALIRAELLAFGDHPLLPEYGLHGPY